MTKLDWVIQTSKGDFEGTDLETKIKDMIQFYSKRDCQVLNIETIIAYDENGDLSQQLSSDEVREIENRIEEEVSELKRDEAEERKGFKAIVSDYYSNLLPSTL